jgi:hypothetical protein
VTTITVTTNVQPARWQPTELEKTQVLAALRNEAYPPAARWGVGPATRKAH